MHGQQNIKITKEINHLKTKCMYTIHNLMHEFVPGSIHRASPLQNNGLMPYRIKISPYPENRIKQVRCMARIQSFGMHTVINKPKWVTERDIGKYTPHFIHIRNGCFLTTLTYRPWQYVILNILKIYLKFPRILINKATRCFNYQCLTRQ